MKYILRNTTLCIGVTFVFFSTVLCMDRPENKDLGLLLGKREQVLSLLKKQLHLFDHHTLCALAINKEWDKLLSDTAPERKKECEAQAQKAFKLQRCKTDDIVILHKYGSAWGRKSSPECKCCRGYGLEMFYLQGKKSKTYSWFSCGSIDFGRPRFDECGDFTYWFIPADRKSCEVWTYGYRKSMPCQLLLEKDCFCEHYVSLGLFIAFPHLLRTFLRFSLLHENKKFEFCDLNKVIIPDNYKECISNGVYKSYDQLPKWWRKVIDRRYHEQKNSL
jgi:hypothetical protein